MKPKSKCTINQLLSRKLSDHTFASSRASHLIGKLTTQWPLIVFLLAAGNLVCGQVAGEGAPTKSQARQGPGRIEGRASDPDHIALQGARIELRPTGQTTATDDQGHFSLSDVPPGTYILTISYIGFDSFSTEATVAPGQVVQADASLRIGAVNQEVIVRGEREHA